MGPDALVDFVDTLADGHLGGVGPTVPDGHSCFDGNGYSRNLE